MEIRKFRREDFNIIRDLHEKTVRYVNSIDYTKEQIETWPGISDNYSSLLKSLEKSISYVALINNKIVGFGDINNLGYISRLYTDKDFQGKGIGSALLKKLEEEAMNLGLKEIKLESTTSAKPFYESKGYEVIEKILSNIQGVQHEDWAMVKKL